MSFRGGEALCHYSIVPSAYPKPPLHSLVPPATPSRWVPNKPVECLKVYGTSSLEHPAVQVWTLV